MNFQDAKEAEKSMSGNIESAAGRESHESSHELVLELKEEDIFQASEILEDPKDGSFIHGLQLFVAWVKNVVAKND